jgi:hypothetical protein
MKHIVTILAHTEGIVSLDPEAVVAVTDKRGIRSIYLKSGQVLEFHTPDTDHQEFLNALAKAQGQHIQRDDR